MSDGKGYGLYWQTPVGWLGDSVPQDQIAAEPLVQVAKKLAYYMAEAERSRTVTGQIELDQLPQDRFHRHDGCRGPHQCEVNDCGAFLSGVFGFRQWKFPTGIVHYILDHSWQPPQAFLDDLALLPDAPEVVAVAPWVAPNNARLFQK